MVPEMSPAERWILFFRYLTDTKKRELINELIKEEERIAMAAEVVLRVSRNERERAWLESKYKYDLDRQSDLVSARRKGELLGAEKERRETARRLRAMGLNPEQIATATGLGLEELP
jgi:predicted transposase/invertase (TIGR01784 family)